MNGQVVITTVRDSLELAPLRALEPEAVFDVDRALGVVRQLLLRVLVQAQHLRTKTQPHVPRKPRVDPVLVPLLVAARLDEELHLHLLELAGAEDEVSWCDLVAETLTLLRDAEWRLLARRLLHVEVVDEDALRSLGSQIGKPRLVFDRTEVGLQQSVEHPRLGERAFRSAVRTVHICQAMRGRLAVLFGVRLFEMVRTKALMA